MFDHDYVKMAISLRSGPLCSLTFMGILTISIDPRKMIRKAGHDSPAKEKLKRMTIQYDQPRYAKTAWIQLQRTEKTSQLISPF